VSSGFRRERTYRTLADITINGSYTLKLRDLRANNLLTVEATEFLQNIQDSAYNSFRSNTGTGDELDRKTEPYQLNNDDGGNQSMDTDENDDSNLLSGLELDNLLALFDQDVDDPISANSTDIPGCYSVRKLKQKGKQQCGFKDLADMNVTTRDARPIFEYSNSSPNSNATNAGQTQQTATSPHTTKQKPPTATQIATILLTTVTRRTRTFHEITNNNDQVDVLDANGSVRSIIDWAQKAGLDKHQKRAFEIFAAHFVLTFFDDSRGENAAFDIDPSAVDLLNIIETEEKKLRELIEDDSSRLSHRSIVC